MSALPPGRPAFAIVTATDAAMEELAIGLCRSLGAAARDLHVIDIGMTASARAWFAGQGVPVIDPPADDGLAARLDRAYFAAMVLRPRLPRLLGAGMVLWIDADCWVQDGAAIDDFRRAAIAAPAGIAACVQIDPDYDSSINNLVGDQDWYRGLHRALFGEDTAAFLYGRAVFSSGVFCARADAPFWAEWDAEVRRIYEEVRPAGDLGHMAEQCAFNLVLHRAGGFALLPSENNWHCHGAQMERRGSRVVIARSGRAPRIVHLSASRSVLDRYRAGRLLYEPPAQPAAASSPSVLNEALDELAALRSVHALHETTLGELRRSLAGRDAELAALAAQDLALRDALDAERAQTAALRASLSWRITAPLRALRRSGGAVLRRGSRTLLGLRNRLAWRR